MAAPMGSSLKTRFPARFAAGAGGDEQRNQVLFARDGRNASIGSALPVREAERRAAERATRRRCVSQAVERAGAFRVFGAEVGAQVVEAHAAADDQHAFIAQRRKRAPGGEVQRRIERSVGFAASDSVTTGICASGKATLSGTKTPWS